MRALAYQALVEKSRAACVATVGSGMVTLQNSSPSISSRLIDNRSSMTTA